MNKYKSLNKSEIRVCQKKMGLLLLKKRLELGISQEDLGLGCDLDQSYIGKIERGEVNVTLETLLKIAHYLKCRVSDLVPIP